MTLTETPTTTGQAAWQRTDTVGTELVFLDHDAGTAEGTAVITGRSAYTCHWLARLDEDLAVTALTVTCCGSGWERTLTLQRDATGWSGADDAAQIPHDALLRLPDSPVFATWAVRRLALTSHGGPVDAPTARVLLPSLTLATGTSTYQLIGPHRLRITGEGPAALYDLDDAGTVIFQPGRARLVRR
ncbi:putative glycolipid-binding domain-containing protein [Dactylosporangium sp. CA-139066]|uniref:putative glycolipid-binding domain-containing protein n=1 Tax=Dactylosporangium sp. CA-139066 TaxID=3239930 RepID=UPI003D946A77